MSYGAIDEELATLFAVCWEKKLAHLPVHERLPSVMSVIRLALVRDERFKGEARAALRRYGHQEIAMRLATKKAEEMRPVVERFAKVDGFEYDDVVGDSQNHELCQTRHKAIWALHEEFGLSKTLAGFCVGGRDHSLALRSIRKVNGWIKADPALEHKLRQIARGETRVKLRALQGKAA